MLSPESLGMLISCENAESAWIMLFGFLDVNGKLRKERFMFYSVRILDENGILKKVVKEKLLSQKHCGSFSNKTGRKRKAKRSFNAHFKSNSDPSLV